MVGELVQESLGAIEPRIRAQVIACLNDGSDPQSAHGLVPGECVVRQNVAKHAGFNRRKPVSALPPHELRSCHRGVRQHRKCHCGTCVIFSSDAAEVHALGSTENELSSNDIKSSTVEDMWRTLPRCLQRTQAHTH